MTDYCSFHAHHIGKSHMTSGLPCQDCSFSWNEEALTVAIVADGHGSSAFVRSDKGSRFAVFAAAKAIKEFTESLKPADDPEAGSGKNAPDDWQDDPGPKGDWTDSLRTDDDWNEAMDLLCRNILRRWYELVDKDCRENPFTPEEVKDVPEKYRDAYLAGEKTQHAYGTTLLAAVVTDRCFFALRNGDGECVALNADGSFSKPIPWNENCESSTTTSLCGTDALADFRFCFSRERPLAVFVGSDGVDDSYTSDEELFSLYRELCLTGINQGGDAVQEAVMDFLPVLTERGSMDDVSIAGVMNCAAMQPLKEKLTQERETLLAARRAEEAQRQLKRLNMKREQLQKELDRKANIWTQERGELLEKLKELDVQLAALCPPQESAHAEAPEAEDAAAAGVPESAPVTDPAADDAGQTTAEAELPEPETAAEEAPEDVRTE